MIPLWIGKFIATRAIKAIKHKIDLNKIDKYVNKPNELDKKIKVVEKRIKKLEAIDYDLYLRKGSDE